MQGSSPCSHNDSAREPSCCVSFVDFLVLKAVTCSPGWLQILSHTRMVFNSRYNHLTPQFLVWQCYYWYELRHPSCPPWEQRGMITGGENRPLKYSSALHRAMILFSPLGDPGWCSFSKYCYRWARWSSSQRDLREKHDVIFHSFWRSTRR